VFWETPSPEYTREFSESLSEKYRGDFEPEAIVQHAAVAAARGSRPVNLGHFNSSRHFGTGICVVADDRPGLLATISAAFVMHGLDVVHGEAYTRTTAAHGREAVDLFWLRESPSDATPKSVGDRTLAALSRTLEEIMAGGRPVRSAFPHLVDRAGSETRVRFLEGSQGELCTLEVEAHDRPGLLMSMAAALRDQRVQIVSCEVHTEHGRAQDRFMIAEIDGAPIDAGRRLAIQVAVLSAVESPPRS
jgi:[protein-PII] uridylyltransferase